VRSWESQILQSTINTTQLTCRGAPHGYPRVEELALLSTGARYEE
jgi:hypothetical protein